ncbi:hypothetical protein SKAU_G00251320 [Synaphobranchus kaupii]|uniref:Uncharacterized protein n=1 Tax=Synaphobranchus kaupii TaxID=118154 RepID=A0A9Q1IRX7_SYNKA|nr:hypothetical protein SKAU_G00251320 [Synaphobranchus kaupii]
MIWQQGTQAVRKDRGQRAETCPITPAGTGDTHSCDLWMGACCRGWPRVKDQGSHASEPRAAVLEPVSAEWMQEVCFSTALHCSRTLRAAVCADPNGCLGFTCSSKRRAECSDRARCGLGSGDESRQTHGGLTRRHHMNRTESSSGRSAVDTLGSEHPGARERTTANGRYGSRLVRGLQSAEWAAGGGQTPDGHGGVEKAMNGGLGGSEGDGEQAK